MFIKKCKKEYTYTLDGLISRGGRLYPGGFVSGIIYSLANGWVYIRGFKTKGEGGGGFKVGFYRM